MENHFSCANGWWRQGEGAESQSWADLSLDIVNLIANPLYYTDQISFQAICWRAAKIVEHADELPWLMGYKSISCYLYDPSHKRKCTGSISAENREKFTDVEVASIDSKQDWVLFKGEGYIMSGIYHSFFLFFYTPFTDEIIVTSRIEVALVLERDQEFNVLLNDSNFSGLCDILNISIFWNILYMLL